MAANNSLDCANSFNIITNKLVKQDKVNERVEFYFFISTYSQEEPVV